MIAVLRRALPGAAAMVRLLLLGAVLSGAAPALAQSLESVLSPGKLIQDHAKYEDDCRSCHIPLDKTAQDRLCQDCHKEVGADVRGKRGFHGKMKPQACRTCHTEHRGRDAKIAEFDKNTFDHQQTNFALRDAHRKPDCVKCHAPGKKYRVAPADCNGCHQKDDVHKGGLGTKCADCHNEAKWKDVVKFDHGKTRFELTGKHVDAKCDSCHKVQSGEGKGQVRYKDTPRTCIGCHKADDKHKGSYSEKCEKCHDTRDWKTILFNHDKDTKFALHGKHRSPPAKCESCHKVPAGGNLYKDKPGVLCIDCHKKDDKHKGTLGNKCGDCHGERDWKEPGGFDHQKTKFPLLGKHQKVECKDCHKTVVFKEAPSTCIGCHRKDDKHAGTLGEQCADCHIERDWKSTPKFDHDKTRFRLRNAHASPKLKCDSCHKDLKSFRKTPMDCYACHRKDDKHEGQQGKECDQCHNDKDWKTTSFDHGRTRFPLTGRHIPVECKKCHETNRYKDARRECYACHKKDDKHKLRFGDGCQKCHSTRDWKIWEFDHDRKTQYKLEGAHRRAACESCHTAPAPAGKDAAPLGKSCVACHRGDDAHDGAFGTQCERCHVVDDWKRIKTRLGGLGSLHEGGWGMETPGGLSDASELTQRIERAGVVLGDASFFARRRLASRGE